MGECHRLALTGRDVPGSVIVKLADEVHVDTDESGDEHLRVRLAYEGQ